MKQIRVPCQTRNVIDCLRDIRSRQSNTGQYRSLDVAIRYHRRFRTNHKNGPRRMKG